MSKDLETFFSSIDEEKKKMRLYFILTVIFLIIPLFINLNNILKLKFILWPSGLSIVGFIFLIKASNITFTSEENLFYDLYKANLDLIKYISSPGREKFKKTAIDKLYKISKKLNFSTDPETWDSLGKFYEDEERFAQYIVKKLLPNIDTDNTEKIIDSSRYLDSMLKILKNPNIKLFERLSRTIEPLDDGSFEKKDNFKDKLNNFYKKAKNNSFVFIVTLIIVSVVISGLLVFLGGKLYSNLFDLEFDKLKSSWSLFNYWLIVFAAIFGGTTWYSKSKN